MSWEWITATIILLLIWTVVFFAFKAGRERRKRMKQALEFLAIEEDANAAAKRPLDEELFFTADLSVLPPLPEGDPFKVERAAKRKMIRFTEPITNIELKKRYGRLQLETLAQYEENFNEYLRALTKWAGKLIEDENRDDALCILEYAVSLGSEFRNTYKFAADIYAKARDAEKLDNLLAKAASHVFRDPAVGSHVVEYIRDKLDIIDP